MAELLAQRKRTLLDWSDHAHFLWVRVGLGSLYCTIDPSKLSLSLSKCCVTSQAAENRKVAIRLRVIQRLL